jgi:hypothetical protein
MGTPRPRLQGDSPPWRARRACRTGDRKIRHTVQLLTVAGDADLIGDIDRSCDNPVFRG